MKAKLENLGITAFYSRPRISNGDPCSEDLLRTYKYRPEYPTDGFEAIGAARQWVARFMDWYNGVHLHSPIRYITPDHRHKGEDAKILAHRHQVYQETKQRYQKRGSG